MREGEHCKIFQGPFLFGENSVIAGIVIPQPRERRVHGKVISDDKS
jgi:hypothetical protein